jgi:hypothetical protein
MNDEKYNKLILEMLDKKTLEMCEFLNKYMTQDERNRIGEDIVRIMPNKGDIAMIKMDILTSEG